MHNDKVSFGEVTTTLRTIPSLEDDYFAGVSLASIEASMGAIYSSDESDFKIPTAKLKYDYPCLRWMLRRFRCVRV